MLAVHKTLSNMQNAAGHIWHKQRPKHICGGADDQSYVYVQTNICTQVLLRNANIRASFGISANPLALGSLGGRVGSALAWR